MFIPSLKLYFSSYLNNNILLASKIFSLPLLLGLYCSDPLYFLPSYSRGSVWHLMRKVYIFSMWGLAYSGPLWKGTSYRVGSSAIYGKALLAVVSCLQRLSMARHFLPCGVFGHLWQGRVLPTVVLNG